MTPVSIPVDFEALDQAAGRLERALELVTTIRTAGAELAELIDVDQADGAVVAALEPVRAVEDHPVAPATPASPPRPNDSPVSDPPAETDEPPPAPAAPEPSPPPAAPPAGATHRPRGATNRSVRIANETRDAILAAFRRLGPDWQTTANVAGEAGYGPGTVSGHLAALVALGQLETNGKGGAHKRHRLTVDQPVDDSVGAEGLPASPDAPATPAEDERSSDSAPPLEPPAAAAPPAAEGERPAPDPVDPARGPGARLPPAAKPSSAHALSPRVRKEREREEAARQAANNGRATLDDPRAGTLEGRIWASLDEGGPCGIRELTRRLGLSTPTEELIRTTSTMQAHGDIRIYPNPHRQQIGQETKLMEALK